MSTNAREGTQINLKDFWMLLPVVIFFLTFQMADLGAYHLKYWYAQEERFMPNLVQIGRGIAWV